MNDKELLKKAQSWFTMTYGKTAEHAGYDCVKIWQKPILGYNLRVNKYAEVVFGPSKKEVDAFIKAQNLIRQGLNWAILLILLNILGIIGIILIISSNNLSALHNIISAIICVDFLAGVGCVVLFVYARPLEKIYQRKIVTYMNGQ